MLDELRTIHEQLIGLIEQLACETRQAAPNEGRLASIRLGLTRASIRRNQLLDNHVYPWLLK